MASRDLQKLNPERVGEVVGAILPNKHLCEVKDRGFWVRQVYELVFEDGERAFMKIHCHADWLDSTANEDHLCKMLRQHGLPAPKTTFLDPTGKHLGFPFILQSALPGKPLSHWLTATDPNVWPQLFTAIGVTYRRIHAIQGPASGVWDGSPEVTLSMSPNDFYLENELRLGSGKAALDAGRITLDQYEKVLTVWEAALPELKSHAPSLVHGSAFPWTICLSKEDECWQVSRLNALGDFLWWDAAFDQAMLVYPPGFAWPEACLEALWDGYGEHPDPWRIQRYALLQHLCALNGIYRPPKLPGSKLEITEVDIIARLQEILAEC